MVNGFYYSGIFGNYVVKVGIGLIMLIKNFVSLVRNIGEVVKMFCGIVGSLGENIF